MQRRLRVLITAVARLALDSEAQRRYLQTIHTFPDANELLDEAEMALDNQVSHFEMGEINKADRLRLMAMTEAINIVRNKRLVAASDLDSPEWAAVRGAAQEFLFGQEF